MEDGDPHEDEDDVDDSTDTDDGKLDDEDFHAVCCGHYIAMTHKGKSWKVRRRALEGLRTEFDHDDPEWSSDPDEEDDSEEG